MEIEIFEEPDEAKVWGERNSVKAKVNPETINNLGRLKKGLFFRLTMVLPFDLKW